MSTPGVNTSQAAKRGTRAAAVRKMTVLPMIAATYFMVAGGPYGLEDIVQKTGYGATLLILVITPLLWSVPTAMMVSELSTSIPEEGGFYIWVRRGLGPFWGYQETWLSLGRAASSKWRCTPICSSITSRDCRRSWWRGIARSRSVSR